MADTTTDTPSTDEQAEDMFSSIDPETLAPELKQIYKGMQADYTRKTQDLAQTRKDFGDREDQFEAKLKEFGGLEQEVTQWRDWYKSLEDNPEEDQGQQAQDPTPTTDNTYLDEPGSDDLRKHMDGLAQQQGKDITSLRAEVERLQSTLKDTTDQTSRMFSYHAQLNDLSGQYKDLDKQELLDYALKAGQMDLSKAYKDLHQDDLIEQEVQQRVEDELKKQRTQGIRGPGRQVLVKPGKNTPKNFEEATQQIMNDRAAQGI